MLRALPLLTLCFAAACTDDAGNYPRLLPTQQILAEPSLPDHAGPADTSEEAVRQQVEQQGAATRARADAIPDPVDDASLDRRAADLRRRADELRRQTETPECPPGVAAPDCPDPAS
ncbi:hypothetical protein [Paracoccus tegillarcae]|uniref:Uncharacterized protein n=1 Tax=Paracoccus tegillarcae TaxID=1529068 RepID=A0A2K9ESN4_9RHOB|nr:hypothetical protein [Paracoccus tegillarcae]AUH34735.1 hypothetical protein CUV01_16300 [Paracoccus tegillarcae]